MIYFSLLIDAFRSRKVDEWNVRNNFFTFPSMEYHFRLISGVQVRVEFARNQNNDVSLSGRQLHQIVARNDQSGSEMKGHGKSDRY